MKLASYRKNVGFTLGKQMGVMHFIKIWKKNINFSIDIKKIR